MSQSLQSFLSSIGEEVVDAEEESFLLFSRHIPSNNLGFVDSRASAIELNINDHDYTIHQSPTLLSSTRDGGTTGAVLWKITPFFAEWISSTTKNPFWTGSHQILNSTATVIELGCGISGLVALTLGPLVGKYIATDQEYVRKYFGKNIDENWHAASSSTSSPSGGGGGGGGGKANSASSKKGGRHSKSRTTSTENVRDNGHGSINNTNIKFVPLDWELDIPGDDTLQGEEEKTTTTSNKTSGFDVLVSCDCIYNEALIPSFVRTCAEICTLRSSASSTSHSRHDKERNETGAVNPTLVIVAQQQRAPDVFEEWLIETLRYFRVWRIDDFKSDHEGKKIDLGDGSGYVVHVLVLRSEFSDI